MVAFKAMKDALCGYRNARVMDNFKDGMEIDCAGSWFREQLDEATSAVANCSYLVDGLSYLDQNLLSPAVAARVRRKQPQNRK